VAGSITVAHHVSGSVRRIVVTWAGDAATGDVPDLVLPTIEGEIVELTTRPGSPAPDDNYDVTLTDQDGVDRLRGLGANRDTATTETVPVFYAGTGAHPVVSRSHVLTLAVNGNAVASAAGSLTILYRPAT
jgi:hypothetical protein